MGRCFTPLENTICIISFMALSLSFQHSPVEFWKFSKRGLLLRVYVWVLHALLSAISVIPSECPCDWVFVIAPLRGESDKCMHTCGPSHPPPPPTALHFSHHLILFLPSCVYPAILLFASFAEQLEDITSNFRELLLQAHRVKLSPVAVFSGLRNTSRTICC